MYIYQVHGIVYVVDASDGGRVSEAAAVLYDMAKHEYVTGKPILILVWYGMVWYGMVWYGMVWYLSLIHI